MASILRQIVAGPRARHPEARLDLCYVTDEIIVTSGPSSVWPKKAYRNPTDQLVAFLDKKHGENWAIFEFRAEGTGYPDSEVYDRIHHFPWPDHHPPPFSIVPNMMAAMRNWIHGDTEGLTKPQRVAVVHCKAGKGRSGTVTCSYLISQRGWKREDALERFTARRMRAGFGEGVSIPSQLRWVRYVDRWTNSMQKTYVERPVEIVEIHVEGLRDGVKVVVEGFADEGRRIKAFHTFSQDEQINVDTGPIEHSSMNSRRSSISSPKDGEVNSSESSIAQADSNGVGMQNVILRAKEPIVLPTSDMNVDFERRNKPAYTGFTMVTSIAHVWFNAFFEGGYEGNDSGVFEIEWGAMDGIKGSLRKGVKALDRLKVVWRYSGEHEARKIDEPAEGEPVPETQPADWKGASDPEKEEEAKHSDGITSGRAGGAVLTVGQMASEAKSRLLGIDTDAPVKPAAAAAATTTDGEPQSASSSSTPTSAATPTQTISHFDDPDKDSVIMRDGVETASAESNGTSIPSQEQPTKPEDHVQQQRTLDGRQDTRTGQYLEAGIAKMASIMSKMKTSESGTQSKQA